MAGARSQKRGSDISCFVIAGLVIVLANGALAQEMCMSDEELRALLAEVTIFGLGQTAGVCCRRHESIRSMCAPRLDALEESMRAYNAEMHQDAVRPFVRVYGSSAEDKYWQYVEEVSAAGRAQTEGFTADECFSVVEGLEGMAIIGPPVIERIVDSFYDAERTAMPHC